MKQSVRYNSRCGFFQFYRGGYDQETEHGIDPYDYDADPVSTAKGYSPTYIMKGNGCLIHCVDDTDRYKIGRFFFGDKWDHSLHNEDMVTEGEWMLLFTRDGRSVFYRKGDPAPEAITKHCKTRNKFYKEWVKPYTEYGENLPPVDITGFKFRKDQNYLICRCGDPYLIIPEHTINVGLSTNRFSLYDDLFEVGVIDLSSSYDWTDVQKTDFAKQISAYKEQVENAKRELEKRKHTAGFCSVCGEPASYVIDPYDSDINGVTHYRWLCGSCYNDLLGDI